jgi:hypothetical protein
MNSIINILYKGMRFFFRPSPLKPLGRWNIDYTNTKINNKVDLANEDHCGPCGQYIINKTPEILKDNKSKI